MTPRFVHRLQSKEKKLRRDKWIEDWKIGKVEMWMDG